MYFSLSKAAFSVMDHPRTGRESTPIGLFSATLVAMGLQIFGTRKCPDTRKAERFLKERGVAYQFIDLADKGISPGELKSVAQALGLDALIDREGERFKKRGPRLYGFRCRGGAPRRSPPLENAHLARWEKSDGRLSPRSLDAMA